MKSSEWNKNYNGFLSLFEISRYRVEFTRKLVDTHVGSVHAQLVAIEPRKLGRLGCRDDLRDASHNPLAGHRVKHAALAVAIV